VGAALLLANGVVVKGANQENIAYPSGLCAERSAMFWAGANYPDVPMETLAIAGSDHGVLCESPASPCGACRQVMAEYQKKYQHPIQIILVGAKRIRKFSCVEDLLPFIFDSLTL
jgi:cytidine deaminase